MNGDQSARSQAPPPHVGQTGRSRWTVTPCPQSEQWNSPFAGSPARTNSTYSSGDARPTTRPCIRSSLSVLSDDANDDCPPYWAGANARPVRPAADGRDELG